MIGIIKVIVGILTILVLICVIYSILRWLMYSFEAGRTDYYYQKLYQKQLREQLGLKN